MITRKSEELNFYRLSLLRSVMFILTWGGVVFIITITVKVGMFPILWN